VIGLAAPTQRPRCRAKWSAQMPAGASAKVKMRLRPKKALRRQARSRTSPRVGDVAALAGVSVATVSRVVNEKATKRASPATVARVRQAIADLNYRPMRAGRMLRTLESHLVALLIPDISNAFYSAIAHSVEMALRKLDCALILCNTDESPELQDAYLDEMQSHLVRAVLLLGAVDSPRLRRAAANGLPIIYMNRKAPPGLSGPFIGIDNYAAGQVVADHFVRQGYGRCGAIHGPLHSSASRERFEGYRDRLADASIELSAADVRGGSLTIESGYRAASLLLEGSSRPRAIFCANDAMAYGAYHRCRELGLTVPDEVALFGFDDNPLNRWLAPWLSTIHVPHDCFGAAAAKLLSATSDQDRQDCQQTILLPFRPVLRASA
jgi:LacI family transcriptional regulator